MLLKLVDMLLKREFQVILLVDIVLFSVLISLYSYFRFVYLILTAPLLVILVHFLVVNLIKLAVYINGVNKNSLTEETILNYDLFQLEMGDLIFRNEWLYKLAKRLILWIFFNYKLRKLKRLENEALVKLEQDEKVLAVLNEIKNDKYLKVAKQQLNRRKVYITKQQLKRLIIDTKLNPRLAVSSSANIVAYQKKLNKKSNSSHYLHLFTKKFSAFFIERWYLEYIGNDQEFILETQMQLELLFIDLFQRVLKIDKLKFASQLAYMFKNNFLNIAIKCNYEGGSNLPLEYLHPALRNAPQSEIAYLKRFVQIALNKSASKLNINQVIAEEFFMQIVGKNCLEKTVNLITKPSFVYYFLSYLCEDEETIERFSSINLFNVLDKEQKEREEHLLHLHQNSNQNLPPEKRREEEDDEPSTSTTPPNIINNKSASRSNSLASAGNESIKSNDANSLDLEKSNEMMAPPTADWDTTRFEIEMTNLRITNTEKSYEPKTGNSFTLYKIMYKYKMHDFGRFPSDQPMATAAADNSNEMSSSNGDGENNWIAKCVKRRHREFVLLHKKLEEHSQLRQYMRSIRGPTKFLTLPIGNMDELYVEKRRAKLSDYLNQLIKVPAICQSKELSSFLSYDHHIHHATSTNGDEHYTTTNGSGGGAGAGGNEYAEFERDNNSSSLVDNGLVKAFSGVFDRITSTTAALNPLSKRIDETLIDSTIEFGKLQINSYQYTDYSSQDIIYAKFNKIKLEFDARHAHQKEPSQKKRNDETSVHLSKTLFECCNQFLLAGSTYVKPMTPQCWVNNRNIYQLIEVGLCDYYLEKFLEEFLGFLFDETSFIEYLQELEDILFVDDDNQSKFIDDYSEFYEFARKQLVDVFPKFFIAMVGHDRFHSALQVFLDAIKHPLLNKYD